MFTPSFGRRIRTSVLIVCLASVAYSQSPIPRGSVIISHLSPDYGLTTDEFVVLFNAGPDTVNLAGYEIRYGTASGSFGSAGAVFSSSRKLPPNRHLLLAPRETVSVGSVSVVRDVPFTSGMAATGGQLLLRRVDLPDSIVFAVAWGSVNLFLAGMTDAAAWPGDGMLSLTWNGSMYERSTFNGSNLQYHHTPSASISVLPTLNPIIPPSPWTISLYVRQGDAADTSVVFGMSEAATDSFDIGLDLPAPPPPVTGQLLAAIERSDLRLATGTFLLRDLRAVRSLTDASVAWIVNLLPAEPVDPIHVTLFLRGLPASMPVRMRLGAQEMHVERAGDSAVCVFVPGSTDRQLLDVLVGDTTAPVVQFLEPAAPTTAVAGSSVRLRALVTDGSEIDSAWLSFIDRLSGGRWSVLVEPDNLGNLLWGLPERLISDSAHFQVEAVDMMGNRRTAVSPNVRVVPDTARRTLGAGWHLISTPLDPIDARWSATPGVTSADSAFPFSYARRAGYRPADTLLPGRGYFLGLLRSRSMSVIGLQPVGTIARPLTSGFVLVASPRNEPTPLSQLSFIRSGEERMHADAIAAGWIGAGLYGFDHISGAYISEDTLRPWQGYWLPVLQEGVSFRVSTVAQSSGARVRSTASRGWMARLVMISHNQIDSVISIGTATEASDGFDAALDLPAPPPPPGGRPVSAWIEHPEWELPTGPHFLTDVRSPRDGHEWNVHLHSDSRRPLSITWRREGGDHIRELQMILSTDRIVRNLGRGDTVHLQLNGTVAVSLRAMVTNLSSTPAVPDAFDVSPGYPNPFNASTHIEISMPERGWLKVRVFDLLGREVGTLAEGFTEAGIVRLHWQPDLSTGIYVARASWTDASGMVRSRTRRLVLIR